jgi:hypothetical protein
MLTLMMLDSRNNCAKKINRHCRNAFGFDSHVVCIVWNLVINGGAVDLSTYSIKHLLWMLAYFKGYEEEDEYIRKFKCCGNNFRNKVWYLAERVASLEIVSLYNFSLFLYTIIYIYIHILIFVFLA